MFKKNPLLFPKDRTIKFTEPEGKSKGILDDFAVRKVVSTREAEIQDLNKSGNALTIHSNVDLSLNKELSLSTDKITATGNKLLKLQYTTDTAKANIAYYNKDDEPVIWLAGHDYLAYPTNRHQHFSVETTMLDGTLTSRLEIPYGADLIDIETHNSNFIIGGTGTFEVAAGTSTLGGDVLCTGNKIGVDSAGTATLRADRAGTSNYSSMVLTTAGTDQWGIRLTNNTTNDLDFRDTTNSRTPLSIAKATGNITLTANLTTPGIITGTTIAGANTNWDTAYTHSQDNTQAHSDYLLNDAADIGVGLTLTGDNSSADTAYVPMVLYNTDATPPVASGFPIGTLYVQYTA